MIEGDAQTPPDEDWVKDVCKIGQGAACCSFITVGGGGWSCEKNGRLRQTILVHRPRMTAQGDNCTGRASR